MKLTPSLVRALQDHHAAPLDDKQYPGPQKMAMLGDCMLATLVVEILTFQDQLTPTDITVYRNTLVSNRALSEYGRVRFKGLPLGDGVKTSLGLDGTTVMGRVVEHVIAVLYLEQGIWEARKFVEDLVWFTVRRDPATYPLLARRVFNVEGSHTGLPGVFIEVEHERSALELKGTDVRSGLVGHIVPGPVDRERAILDEDLVGVHVGLHPDVGVSKLNLNAEDLGQVVELESGLTRFDPVLVDPFHVLSYETPGRGSTRRARRKRVMPIVPTPEFVRPIRTLQSLLAYLWTEVQGIPGADFAIETYRSRFIEFAAQGGRLTFPYKVNLGGDTDVTLVVTGRTEIPIIRNGQELKALSIEAGVITTGTNFVPRWALQFAELHQSVAALAIRISERRPNLIPLEGVDPSDPTP